MIGRILRQLRAAGEEDRLWAQVCAGVGGREVVGWDTRFLRPWGPSVAVERFVVALGADREWLAPLVWPWVAACPLGVRAIVVGRAAYVCSYSRGGVVAAAKLAWCGRDGAREVAVEPAPQVPPADLGARLAAPPEA